MAKADGAQARATSEKQLRSRARKLADQALKTLDAIMEGDGQDSVRLAAAREVLDRGFGRTKLGGPDSGPEGAPYTVVVRRYSDPPDRGLEDFE